MLSLLFCSGWPEGFTPAAHRLWEGTWWDFCLESTWESRIQRRREITHISFSVPRPIVWPGICFLFQLFTSATVLFSVLKVPFRFLPLRRSYIMYTILRGDTRKFSCCHFLCLVGFCLVINKGTKPTWSLKPDSSAQWRDLEVLWQRF